MRTNSVEFNVLIKGRPITEYRHEGLTFVEGRHRSEFELKIKNNHNGKRLFVPSVDGLSTVDGNPAGNDSLGFIVDPYEEVIIPGWMRNDETAAKFYFSLSQKEASYSSKMGYGDQNNGVIGVRVFDEKPVYRGIAPQPFPDPFPKGPSTPVDPWHQPMTWSSSQADGHPGEVCSASFANVSLDSMQIGATAEVEAQSLGTGWGQDTDFNTTKAEFEKGDHVSDLIIYYDTLRGLEARGVDVKRKKARRSTMGATAFPGDYCQPPK